MTGRRVGIAVGIACLIALLILATSGCASKVVTETVVVEKPVPVLCEAPDVLEPVWALDTVQLTGDAAVDLVLLWRAAEAEIEQRIAYELALRAALQVCSARVRT